MNMKVIYFYYEKYLNYQKSNLKEVSIKTIKNRFEKNILPFFENKKINFLYKQNNLNDFKISVINKNLSYSFKRNILVSFNCFLNYLKREENIKNIKNIKLPKKQKYINAFNIVSVKDIKKLIDQEKKEIFKIAIKLLFFSGIRKGELFALTKQDLRNNKIRVNKTFSKYKQITTPKTPNATRIVIIPRILFQELLKIDCKNRIFENISFSSLERHFKIMQEKANIKNIRLHDLRHSFITTLIYNNFTLNYIAQLVGHSDTSIILKNYAHILSKENNKFVYFINKEFETIE